MSQVIEMTYVVALEFKAGAIPSTSPQGVLNILKSIPEHQVSTALQVVVLPRVAKLLEALQHWKEAKVHRAHVERRDFRFKRESRLDALLNFHIGRTTAGQIDYCIGRLLNFWQKGSESGQSVVWFPSLRIAR